MRLESLETIAFDIRHSVFDNETEAIMYVTKDIHSDRFIIAIPVITFAMDISMEQPERDYEWLLKANGIAHTERKEKLIAAIKSAIEEFYR